MTQHTLTLTITMESDWHIGSGSGIGRLVDQAIRRDEDGLPFIPARSVLGVWRDAAESLATMVDGADGRWTDVVDAVFGLQPSQHDGVRPVAGLLTLSPARLAPALRKALQDCPSLAQSTCYLSPFVAMDAKTGAAKSGQHFIAETARRDATLSCVATIDIPDRVSEAATAFLAAAAEGIQEVGGKRRRGRGRCNIRINGHANATPDFFDRWIDKAPTAADLSAAVDAVAEPVTREHGDWTVWDVTISLEQPLLTIQETSGNVVIGKDYLPGTTLLAAIAKTLGREGVNAMSSILAGDVLMRNAYLRVEGRRGLPTPLCLSKEKGTRVLRSMLGDPRHNTQWQQLRGRYIESPPSSPLVRNKTPRVRRTHNVIDDEYQRPTAAVGGVYTYDAIDSGTVLIGQVLARGNTLIQSVESALSALARAPVFLGKARKADYGRVRLSVAESVNSAASLVGDTLTLWFASPVLLLDTTSALSPTPDALRQALIVQCPSLGTNVTLDPKRTWARQFRQESWHGRWSLSRPSLCGYAAGSVFVFTGASSLTTQDLSRLQTEGLGQRRPEGFGEVVANPEWLTNPPSSVTVQRTASPKARAPSPDDLHTLRQSPFGQSLLRAAAESAIRVAASNEPPPAWQGKTGILSTIGALRTSVASSLSAQDVRGRVREWRARLDRKSKRGLRWARPLNDSMAAFEQEGAVYEHLELPWFDDDLRTEHELLALRTLLVNWCQEVQHAARKTKGYAHGA